MPDVIFVIILFFVAAGLIWLVVNYLMQRFDVTPADPDARAGGFQDVIDRLRSWRERRDPPDS